MVTVTMVVAEALRNATVVAAMGIVRTARHIMVTVMVDGTMDMGIIMVVNLEEIRVAVVPTNIW